jgi:hypothetical protein
LQRKWQGSKQIAHPSENAATPIVNPIAPNQMPPMDCCEDHSWRIPGAAARTILVDQCRIVCCMASLGPNRAARAALDVAVRRHDSPARPVTALSKLRADEIIPVAGLFAAGNECAMPSSPEIAMVGGYCAS